ncbi:MAG: VOC family protein [Dehalococcoidia bacterium]|nr:VOC family protein [Dehalococcoidia bacterium]
MQEPAVNSIEEVVIAVEDVEKAAARFEDLFGMKFEAGWELAQEKIKVKSERIAGTQLQFIQSTSPEGVVAKFIESKGEGLNHFAFRVTNLKEMVNRLKQKGVKFVPEEPVEHESPDILIGKGSVAYIFIHPKSACGTLIELIEAKE